MEVIVTKQRNVKDGQPMQQGNMQKEAILNRLRQRGCRITKQRMLLLDIILEEECSSCKEIYYKASKIDSSIGSATVYRMINMLEEIGAINRRNMYKVSCEECEEAMDELPGGTSRSVRATARLTTASPSRGSAVVLLAMTISPALGS